MLISPFDALPTPPPHIVRGNQALKEFFHIYMNYQGSIQVEKLYDFAETDDSIFFQAIFTSKTGRWVVGRRVAHARWVEREDRRALQLRLQDQRRVGSLPPARKEVRGASAPRTTNP